MTLITQTSLLLSLPIELQVEIMNRLSLKALSILGSTCRTLREISVGELEKKSIHQLLHSNPSCSWSREAIILIQSNYNKTFNVHSIAHLVSGFTSDPCHLRLYPLLKELKCDQEMKPHNGPCICEFV